MGSPVLDSGHRMQFPIFSFIFLLVVNLGFCQQATVVEERSALDLVSCITLLGAQATDLAPQEGILGIGVDALTAASCFKTALNTIRGFLGLLGGLGKGKGPFNLGNGKGKGLFGLFGDGKGKWILRFWERWEREGKRKGKRNLRFWKGKRKGQ